MADGVDYPKADPKPKRKRKNKKRNPENKKLGCPDCNRKFYFKCQLNHHRMVHTGEKPYVCDICEKAFNTSYSLKNHKYIHTDEKPFQCSFCQYACRDSSTLRKHQAKHKGVETIYGCKLCAKSYKHKYQLKAHVAEAHLNVDLKKLPCDKCGKRFKTNSQLNTHVKLVHKRAKSGHCPVCNVYIPMIYNLSAHLNTHVDAKPYRCTAADCNSAFKDKNSLCKHMRIHNLDEQFPCDICGRMFSRRHRLNYHVLSVHGKRKRVECDYCGVRFYSKAYLVNHIQKKHAPRRKRYECDICGLTTYNKPSIVMHLKYAHRHDDDRTCKICHTVYKKHIYLKHHYKFTHKIAYKTKTRPTLVIKEEPPDDESVHSIDLFEVEKTEQPDEESKPNTDEAQPHQEIQTEVECERLSDIPHDAFDEFYVQHITRIQEGDNRKKSTETKSKGNVDKKALEFLKKSKVRLLAEARRKEAARALERARQVYNERMRKIVERNAAAEENKKPIKIKLFRKKQVNCSNVGEKSTKIESASRNIDEKHDQRDTKTSNDVDDETSSNPTNNNNITVSDQEKTNTDNELKDLDADLKSDDVKTESDDQKPLEDVDEPLDRDDDDVTEDEKLDDDRADEEWSSKKEQKNRKINFNSHQCYVCFKLYDTKEKLLDHCKDHFEVCNDTALKKCPLCAHVTERTIARHLRRTHGLSLPLPYGRLQDKLHNTDGCRYYLQLDDPVIQKIEVIPSIKNLNKIASMKIDKKRREDKEKTLAKTKLVKKGKEWVVETERIHIDKDVLMPEFDSDAVKNLDKISDSDGYLDGLKKLYHIAKKSGKTMLFPCQSCDKICRNFAALKLHNRKHEANPKPFKKKVWKHKLKDAKTAAEKPVGSRTKAKKIDNRTAKPKPIKNKHKCDPELKQFYENNIRGGDIEFWQFLKIFNKMGRDNIKDFKDLEGRHEYGILIPEENRNNEQCEQVNENQNNCNIVNDSTSDLNPAENICQKAKKQVSKNNICVKNKISKRVMKINKQLQNERNLLKQKLREKNSDNFQRILSIDIKERNLAKQRLRDKNFLQSQTVASK